MAINKRKFAPLSHGSAEGPNAFVYYDTASTKAQIEGANFFDPVQARIRTGDWLLALGSDAGGVYQLTNTLGVITLAAFTGTAGVALLSGAAFTGAVTVQAPTADAHPATKKYVDEFPLRLNVAVVDLAAAASHWLVSPVAGTITKIHSVIEGAVDVNTTLTAKIGGVAVTNGVITITAAGSAAGDVDTATPTAANTVTAGQAIEIACGGEGAVQSRGLVMVEITPS